jgi:uncharacterized protein (UPF0332 family)
LPSENHAVLLPEGAEPRAHEGIRTMLGFYPIRTGRMPLRWVKSF